MKREKRFCPHCKIWFEPDSHNSFHQEFCAGNEECRRASHRVSVERNRIKTQLTDPEKHRQQQEEAKIRLHA